MGHYLRAKAVKATLVLDPVEVLALKVPETGKGFHLQVRIGEQAIDVPLNAKGVRKAVAAVKELGAENVAVIVTGRLKLGEKPVMEDAGMLAQPKAKKPVETVSQQVAA